MAGRKSKAPKRNNPSNPSLQRKKDEPMARPFPLSYILKTALFTRLSICAADSILQYTTRLMLPID